VVFLTPFGESSEDAASACAAAAERAFAPGASDEAIFEARQALRALAERASPDSPDGDEMRAVHRVLYFVHRQRAREVRAAADWIAQGCYPALEARVAPVELERALPPAELIARVKDELSMRGRLGSAMSQHLFAGAPSLDDVRVYMRHHWFRSRWFFQLLADFAARSPLEDTGLLFRNLVEETGGLPDGPPAHALLLKRLTDHLGLGLDFDDHPSEWQALQYLNNQARSARTTDAAWGLAVLFASETTTPETHGNILAMLRRLGVPEDCCEFHRVHAACDAHHAADLEAIIARRIRTASEQRTFLRALAEHRRTSRIYFELVWEQMRSAKP
jgi:pyrroloquinoline quinone (PQQ) biosynthesis protein C